MQSDHMTIPELARHMGLSRIAVYAKVRKGQIPATRIGRNYVIFSKDVARILHRPLSKRDRQRFDRAVQMVVSEYGVTLKCLSKE